MAEENHNQSEHFSGIGLDDMSVLNILLHTIKGISPISTSAYGFEFSEDEMDG